MNRIAQTLTDTRRALYASTYDADFRSFVAALRILTVDTSTLRESSRRKVAYSPGELTRAVNDLLRKARLNDKLVAGGYDPVPNVDWGKIIFFTARKYANRMSADLQDVIGEFMLDIIAGERSNSIRNTGQWRGNVVDEIEGWAMQGASKNHMEALMTKWSKHKLYNMMRTDEARTNPDMGFDSGDAPDDLGKGSRRMYENIFTMEGLTRDMMSNWTALIRSNPVMRDLVRKIHKSLARRDDDYGLIFQAYMQEPSASIRDLLEISVEGTDPDTGRETRLPLWRALNLNPEKPGSHVGGLGYRIKNMRELLKSMFPEIESVLRDLQAR
jgi:hypothetical protein